MTADSQDLKALLLETDDEFRQLATKHQELESRLQELSAKSYLSQPEQVEAITLKKRKLQLKDRMETIVRRHRERPASTMTTEPHTTPNRH
ncbi:MAG: YdcH family protein [Acidobacteria bacterium]|nr:YdcH family protein [Acidobacteriota bacterium]MBE3096285.1 YdcH family protein [Planctomycetota bacterium]MBE3133053.1 YdcH family protein [Acidobacteriota bacterium]